MIGIRVGAELVSIGAVPAWEKRAEVLGTSLNTRKQHSCRADGSRGLAQTRPPSSGVARDSGSDVISGITL